MSHRLQFPQCKITVDICHRTNTSTSFHYDICPDNRKTGIIDNRTSDRSLDLLNTCKKTHFLSLRYLVGKSDYRLSDKKYPYS